MYRVSPNAVYKFGGEVANIVRNHNYIGKHGRKAIGGAVRELASSESVVFPDPQIYRLWIFFSGVP